MTESYKIRVELYGSNMGWLEVALSGGFANPNYQHWMSLTLITNIKLCDHIYSFIIIKWVESIFDG